MLYELIDDLLEHVLERTGMTFKDEPKAKEISRRLKIFARIKYNCEQSINQETKVKLSTLEGKEGGL
jgi:hypothetical protein